MLKLGTAIVFVLALAALAGPSVVGTDPGRQELALRLTGPSLSHPFGLDDLGRDILARMLAGARISFAVAVIVVSLSAGVGTMVGAIAGYVGGMMDDVLGRAIDILLAFPGLLLAIALVAVLGPSLGNVLLALSVIGWVGYARLARGQVLRVRHLGYVEAARALGASGSRVLLRHLVPAIVPMAVVQASLGMAGAIIGEAALSFLGLGVQPPTPSWGAMLSGGRAHLLDAPHLTLFPGVGLALLVLGFNFIGDGLRDRMDPKRRQAGTSPT